jgi:hypothetical protein
MARRRHKLIRSASYYRANPLSNTELIVGGLVGVAVLGLGGYLLYQKYGSSSSAALPTGAQVAAPGTFGSATAAGVDASGNPLPPAVPYSATG